MDEVTMLFAPINGVPSPSTTLSYITFRWLTKASSLEISMQEHKRFVPKNVDSEKVLYRPKKKRI
jgi:hypothetical protein